MAIALAYKFQANYEQQIPVEAADHKNSDGANTVRMRRGRNEENVIARVTGIALFANNPPIAQAEFAEESLTIILKDKGKNRRLEGWDIREATSNSQLLFTKLTVTTHAGRKHSIGGLKKKEAKTPKVLIVASIGEHRMAAQRLAEEISAAIIKAYKEAKLLLSQPKYLRQPAKAAAIQKESSPATVNHGFAEEFTSPQAREALADMRQMLVPEGIEPERQEANDRFVAGQIDQVKSVALEMS